MRCMVRPWSIAPHTRFQRWPSRRSIRDSTRSRRSVERRSESRVRKPLCARRRASARIAVTVHSRRGSAGIVGMWEKEHRGRIGVEAYFTGVQRLEDNPYRSQSEPYVLFGGLIERRFGRVRLFVNAENLGGVRQTRFDPLVRPFQAVDGRWTVDAWAPLDGRVVNGGIRLSF